MPDVNYIVTSLPDYVKNNAELISKRIALGTPTVKRITPMTGVKSSAYINFLGVDAPLQNGRGCDTSASGSATMTNRQIVTAVFEKKVKICPDTLLGKWAEYEVNIAADKRDKLPFEAYLVAELILETQEQIENLVWNGKTAAQGGTDLIDGFLTILGNESTAIKFNVTASATAFEAVREVIAKVPAALKKKGGVKLFVSPEFFEALGFELVDKNLYHYDPKDGESESLIFPGTRVEVINTPGLAGTSKIVASVIKNMYFATDEADAERRVKIVYNEENDYFLVKFRFNAGVNVAFPDWCVVGTLQ